MSFATSFGLSLKNLFTKKGRTLLTSFAGSIGIIGIALIYAVSQGATAYINEVQEDTLSAYPLTIEATHTSMSALMDTFRSAAKSDETHEKDAVYPKSAMYDMVNALNSMEEEKNDLRSFKAFIDEKRDDPENPLYDAISAVKYTYDTDLLVYTENIDGNIIRSDSSEMMKEIIAENMGASLMAASSSESGTGGMSSIASMGGRSSLWQEMLAGDNGKLVSPLLEKQYDVVYGAFPTQYNEIVLVIDENNELDDMSLYALGLNSKEEMSKIITAALNGEEIEKSGHRWTYDEICNMEFRIVLNSDCYILDENTGLYTDLRSSEAGLRYLYDNALILKVSGIIRPNENASSAMISGAIGYTSELTKFIIEKSENSNAVKAQLESPETDIFTGLPFSEAKGALSDSEKESEFRKYIDTLDEHGKADTYVKIMSIPTEEQINAALEQTMGTMTRDDINEMMISAFTQQMSVNEADVRKYVTDMSDDEINEIFAKMMAEQLKEQMSAQIKQQIGIMSAEEMSAAFSFAVKDFSTEKCAALYDEIIEFSKSTYEENLLKLGKIDLEEPSSISLYASSFSDKDVIEDTIADYNSTVSELSEIKYTDYVGLMMSSITTIINAISYLLISFVAISLIVSSIMIGVITLISVQERTKEIGILRAIGASKKNVSSMFNAETVIIGFTSGLLGVGVTYLLCIPINLIIHKLTGIDTLSAFLPIPVAIVLIVISMLLTLTSGIIPSRSAAKKDPVVALRTE